MRREAGLALLLIALVSPGALGWEQLRGSGLREGAAVLPDRLVDVVASYDLIDGTWHTHPWTSPTAVWTPHGLVLQAHNGDVAGECAFVLLADPAAGGPVQVPYDGCGFGQLEGYDPVRDVVLVCDGSADAGVLQARNPRTGELMWDIRPERDLGSALPSISGSLPGPFAGFALWNCGGAAFDLAAREVVVPFTGGFIASNRIASIDLDTQTPRWVRQVPMSTLVGGLPSPLLSRDQQGVFVPGADAYFLPQATTLTETGVLVTGLVPCPACAGTFLQVGVAWLTREGNVTGGAVAVPDRAALDQPGRESPELVPGGSRWGTASGGVAAHAIGRRLWLIDPSESEPRAYATIATECLTTRCTATGTLDQYTNQGEAGSANWVGWEAPVWWKNTILLPLLHSVTAFDADGLAQEWAWVIRDWNVLDLLVADENAYVLIGRAANASAGGDVLQVVRLGMEDGEVLQRLPLPYASEGAAASIGARLVPAPGKGLLVIDAEGGAVFLGPTVPELRPAAQMSARFPAPGESVDLDLQPPEGADLQRVLVAWGDGTAEEFEAGAPIRHTYATPGAYEVVATAVYAGGRTATTAMLVDVGGTPPQDLTFMQTAFAPENQDMTWGVIGLAMVGTGAFVTLHKRRRHHGRLQRDLAMLEDVRQRSIAQPALVIRDLEAYRRSLQIDLASGRLEDGQYSMLELQVARILRASRNRLLAPYAERMSPGYQRLLEAALEDGIVSDEEARSLTEGLEAERRLSTREKIEIAVLFKEWTGQSLSVGGAKRPRSKA